MRSLLWRILFHKDSVLLLIAIIWVWLAISIIVDANYDITELVSHKGRLEKVSIIVTGLKSKPLFKDTTRELRITIDNNPGYFSISSKEDLSIIEGSLFIGDSVSVFTKKKVLGIFGYGGSRSIFHLVSLTRKRIIIDYNERKRSSYSVSFLVVFAALFFITWYITKVRKRLYWED